MDLNLDIDSLALVTKEITSSTLTTRLKGICKINRLIDHINELTHQQQHIHEHQQHQQHLLQHYDTYDDIDNNNHHHHNDSHHQRSNSLQDGLEDAQDDYFVAAAAVEQQQEEQQHQSELEDQQRQSNNRTNLLNDDQSQFLQSHQEDNPPEIDQIYDDDDDDDDEHNHEQLTKEQHQHEQDYKLSLVSQMMSPVNRHPTPSPSSLDSSNSPIDVNSPTSQTNMANLQAKIGMITTTPSPPLTNTSTASNQSTYMASGGQFIEAMKQERFQANMNTFRDWIIENKIIEHIFGPNCHLEIIKQSHTILNFVAYALDDEHVNVIWSASSLKHCGRQVLDLLTSLVRFMRTGPVLHLYGLVKDLNIEEHSEHTLLLTSHILRYIWSHSPCINQVQLCNFQNHNDYASFNSQSAPSISDHKRSSIIAQQEQLQQNQNQEDRHHNCDQNQQLHSQAIDTIRPKAQSKQTNIKSKNTNQFLDEIHNSKTTHQNIRQHHQSIPLESILLFKELKKTSNNLTYFTQQFSSDEHLKKLASYNLENLCDPEKTLLWDLLQDGKIEYLSTNLHIEVENVLVNLVMTFGDRNIRYRFIEACLENLSVRRSVTISLRLVPKLMSINTISRSISLPAINETHAIILWAEQDYKMSENFFIDLVQYYKENYRLLNSVDNQSTEGSAEDRQAQEISEFKSSSPLFNHIDQIITRMSFLTFIYSKTFSPEEMKLNQEQIDQLWSCLANDPNPRCSDVLFQWIYQQAIGEDFHGINDELLNYILRCKLPSLEAKNFRLRGLKLLEQLLWIRQDYECCHGLEHPANRLLWDIGLLATDDEVSMAAIRILNHFYIYTNHHNKTIKSGKSVSFMNYCMNQIQATLSDLIDETEPTRVCTLLDVMQKVILLIRTHLEVFRAHWSYHLRILQLNNEADLISHRLNAYDIKLTLNIRLVCHAASSMDKTTIEMQSGDFVGELRAEIVKWWFTQVDRTFFEQSGQFSSNMDVSPGGSSSITNDHDDPINFNDEHRRKKDGLNEFTEFLLANQQSIRLLSHQQEIPFEWDERQINELDFKDMQVIYVLGDLKPTSSANVEHFEELSSDKVLSSDPTNGDLLTNEEQHQQQPLALNHIRKSDIPSLHLLKQEHFDTLIELDKFLGSFKSDHIDLVLRAKVLSKRVWDIIQILPTSPNYKLDIRRCGIANDEIRLNTAELSNILSAECPQRLLYSLQTIDILKSSDDPHWGATFIRKGGLADIYDVFMSEKLLPNENEEWNEWLQECLAYLLKLLFQFGIRPASGSSLSNESTSSSSSSKLNSSNGSINSSKNLIAGNSNAMMSSAGNSGSCTKKNRRYRSRQSNQNEERLLIPRLSDGILGLIEDTDLIFERLMRILRASAFSKNNNDQYLPFYTMSSRAMIVNHVMSFLASWCKSDIRFPKFHVSKYEDLLKELILHDVDSSIRRETCNGLFKLHHASSTKFCSPTSNISIDSINSLNTSSNMSDLNQSNYIGCDINNKRNDSMTSIANSSTSTSSACNSSNNNWNFSTDLLACLIKFLPIAEVMKPPKPIRNYVSETDYIRELNAPGCKDYFWLTCRLIDSCQGINPYRGNSSSSSMRSHNNQQDQIDQGISIREIAGSSARISPEHSTETSVNIKVIARHDQFKQSPIGVNLYELCDYLVVAIRNRRTFETRDFSVEDDSLRGMLLMMVMSLKRDPSFRYTQTAFEFIHELYDYLFAPPNKLQRYLPKCKSPTTRSTAFELMISLVDRCPKNYFKLVDLLIEAHHNSVVKNTYPSDYWPHDDCRSEFGFVGLINLGATCYLATCMQHLFMIPHLRYAVLSVEDTKDIRHGEIIRELQKIFAFMLESERKAYNPKNFCKVYTMDNHPLNIAEQTDMTEFFTDLITKLEESSPELRHIIKSLFSGSLSNNVVSLDCPHISRTSEEFYTLRVQVADMRSLNDSLDELTIKDTLEGDNMYTCSTCEKKVRAQKRACIVKLPRILCFNTMRYTFNMATMTKEKVNTHFSFPLKLDMTDYLEENLMKRQQMSSGSHVSKSSSSRSLSSDADESTKNFSPDGSPSSENNTLNNDKMNDKPASSGNETSSMKHGIGMNQNKSKMSPDESGAEPSKRQKTADVTKNDDNQDGQNPSNMNQPCDNNNDSSSRSNTSTRSSSSSSSDSLTGDETSNVYELIGVTVHTGNADGGHYYCFIRDCEDKTSEKPRWYLFNDAEVKPFDDSHIGTECYGGELTTKSYDAINDRFMDFSIEKTNSAYMLFYKRVDYKYLSKSVAQKYLESDTERSLLSESELASTSLAKGSQHSSPTGTNLGALGKSQQGGEKHGQSADSANPSSSNSMISQQQLDKSLRLASPSASSRKAKRRQMVSLNFETLCAQTYEDFQLPKHLANWILTDNMKFYRDKNVFEHNYFNFIWQVCSHLPKTLNYIPESILELHQHTQSDFLEEASEDATTIKTVHLAITFVLGVLMNSRERPNLSNWTDLIRKQFHSSKVACDWLMQLIDDEETWLKQMLLRCPIEMVRQLFQRLCNDLTGPKQHKKLRLIK